MSDLEILDREIEQLLANVSPEARRGVANRVARALRRSQAERIAAQRNPDGSGFEPRKARGRRPGELKRKARARAMFRKLRSTRYLRTRAGEEEVEVGYLNAMVARVARVHQLGLRDRVSRQNGSPEITYAQRQLLGFADPDRQFIIEQVFDQVRGGR